MTAIEQQTVDAAEVFVDLVLGDDDLVRDEFDALIAACWESPRRPSRRKPCPPDGGWAAWPPRARERGSGPPAGTSVPTRRPDGRGRGPPA
ncbi:hypothetical protein [Kribbella swartbergensis]